MGLFRTFGGNFNSNLFGIEVDLKLLFVCPLELVVGPLWKKVLNYLHIKVALWDPFESIALAY